MSSDSICEGYFVTRTIVEIPSEKIFSSVRFFLKQNTTAIIFFRGHHHEGPISFSELSFEDTTPLVREKSWSGEEKDEEDCLTEKEWSSIDADAYWISGMDMEKIIGSDIRVLGQYRYVDHNKVKQ